jgi:hypothetical protein
LDTNADQRPFSYYIGWCLVFAAAVQLPMVYVAIRMLQVAANLSTLLLLTIVPTALLLALGGTGLILRRFWGYHCVYLATLLGGFGGLKVPYLPIQSFVKLGPRTEDFFLGLNLVIVAFLAAEHLLRASELEPRARATQRTVTAILLSLALASVAYGRSLIVHAHGDASSTRELPRLGKHLENFDSDGPVSYVSVHTKGQNGITMVFSGATTASEMEELVQKHSLTRVEDSARRTKMLSQARRWKLDTRKFPTDFDVNAQFFIGRITNGGKTVFQIAFDPATRRFTAEAMGLLPQ